jgi:lipoprotein-anchoring transpeptidase ErfK/SrfK
MAMFGTKFGPFLIAALVPVAVTAAEIDPATFNAADFAERPSPQQIDPAVVKAQILLDRANISPGEIDGRYSPRMEEEIAAFAESRQMPADTTWSRAFWLSLTSSVTGPVLTDYVITRDDVKGPFVQLPAKLEEQQGFRALGYANAREALAERFHMSEDLLAALNPGASFSNAGERIIVANVVTERKPAAAARLDVDKDRQTVKVYSGDNDLLAFFPASVGSEDKPTPSGTLKVTLIESDPAFHYNPRYQFKEVETRRAFNLRPGPNNPLGTMWIALSKPSYGIHGTPDPAQVGSAASHGCVRLTNWDVQRLADMLSKGTPVNFIEKLRGEPDGEFTSY